MAEPLGAGRIRAGAQLPSLHLDDPRPRRLALRDNSSVGQEQLRPSRVHLPHEGRILSHRTLPERQVSHPVQFSMLSLKRTVQPHLSV